jgi:hypothetical protein
LQVGVHGDYCIAAGVIEAGGDRDLVAEVAGEVQRADCAVPLDESGEDLQ